MNWRNEGWPVQSGRVRLRQTTEVDLEYVLAAEQHEENRQFIFQWSREQHLESLANPNFAHLLIETCLDSRPVGLALIELNDSNDGIGLRRIVITEKGKGYGREALQCVKHLAFAVWHGHRLFLDVKEYNARARHLYQSEGFVIEGILRECLKVGEEYESLVVMSMLRSEYDAPSASG